MNVLAQQILILPKNLISVPMPLVIMNVVEFDLRVRTNADMAAVQNASPVNAM